MLYKLTKTPHWEAKVPLTISWQSAIALYEKKEHAFADNLLKLDTKQGPAAQLPHAHPLLVQPTWQRNIFPILTQGCVELITNAVYLIDSLF